jgi:hypothetical protein
MPNLLVRLNCRVASHIATNLRLQNLPPRISRLLLPIAWCLSPYFDSSICFTRFTTAGSISYTPLTIFSMPAPSIESISSLAFSASARNCGSLRVLTKASWSARLMSSVQLDSEDCSNRSTGSNSSNCFEAEVLSGVQLEPEVTPGELNKIIQSLDISCMVGLFF